MAIILDLVNTGTIPQSFASGSWPITAFNTGKWRFTWTPTQASTNAAWRPTGSSVGFWCLFGGLTEPNGSGIWLEYVVSTQVHSIVLVRTSDGNVIANARVPFTWNANQAVTFTCDMSSASANAASLAVSGAATGNTSATFTRETILAADTLQFGRWGATSTYQLLASSVSDVDDTVAAAIERTATMTIVADAVTAATRTLSRSAALAMAAAATVSASGFYARTSTLAVAADAATAMTATTPGALERTATIAVAADATAALSSSLLRSSSLTVATDATSSAASVAQRSASMSVAADAVSALTITGAVSFGPGVQQSGMWIDGHSAATCTIPGGYFPTGSPPDADGRTPIASLDTQVSGSTFYGIVMRPVATANKTITDNKGNTFTSLGRNDYGVTSPWEVETFVRVAGAGGVGHTFTANSILFDETTLAIDEIKACSYLAANATSFTASGATQISPAVNLKGPGWVYVDWSGDGPVSGAEGFDWTVTAVNEGPTVGSQWQVVDSRIRNHTNGWIQWKRWRRFFAAATSGIQLQIATVSPAQGARWHAAAFMEANVTEVTATLSVSATATTAITAAFQRAAAMSVLSDAVVAAARNLGRLAAMSVDAVASTGLVPVRERSASLPVTADAATSLTTSKERLAVLSITPGSATDVARTLEKATSLTITADVASGVSRSQERASATTVVADAVTALSLVSGSFSVTVQVTPDAFTALTLVSAAYSVTMLVTPGASASMARTMERAASLAVFASAASSLTIPGALAVPLPAVLRASAPSSAPFRISAPHSAPFKTELS